MNTIIKYFAAVSLTLICMTFSMSNIFAVEMQFDTISKSETFNNFFTNDETEELLKSAFELYRQKKYAEALEKCKKAGELNPREFRVYWISGAVHLAQWQLKDASDNFAKAIELQPTNKLMYLYKAKADYLRNERGLAETSARQAIKLDGKFAEAYQMLGDALRYNKEKSSEAVEAYQTALKLDPKLPGIYESLGGLYRETGNLKGAEELLRQGMEADPQKMNGRFDLGRMLVKEGRLAEARKLWDERTSDRDRTFPNFITVLERAEKLDKATKALALKPNDPETLLQMGIAVMDGDSWVVDRRQERAIVHFRKALELKPDFVTAQFQICRAFVQIADTFSDKNKTLDEELAKLSKMDQKLAKEIEEYRKTYSGGLKVAPSK